MRRLLTALKKVPPVLFVGIVVAALGVAAVIWMNSTAAAPSCPAPATVEQQE